MLVSHHTQSFLKASVQPLNQHWVVISAAEDVTINLQKVQCYPTYPKNLSVLVKDACVAKAIPQNDFHNGGGVCGNICVGNWLHCTKCTHAATGDKIVGQALKTRGSTRLISIGVQDQERRLNWKTVNELPRFALVGIDECAAGTLLAHPRDVRVHFDQ